MFFIGLVITVQVDVSKPHLHVSSIYSINDHHHSHSLLLASHSLRSISLGSTTSSLRSKSTTRIFVYSSSKYCFFSSAGGFFPFGFVFDFLQHRRKEDRLKSCEWLDESNKRIRKLQSETQRKSDANGKFTVLSDTVMNRRQCNLV